MSVISDTISAITAVIMFTIITFGRLDFVAGFNLRRVSLTILFASFAISMMNLALVAVDRYFAIVRPLSPFYRNRKRKFLIITEVLIWLVVISTKSPMLIDLSPYPELPTACNMTELNLNQSMYFMSWLIISYVIPITMIFLSYARIAYYQKDYVRPEFWTSKQLHKDFTKTRKFIKMLIYIKSCYILLSLPLFVCSIVSSAYQKPFLQILPGNIYLFLLNYIVVGLVLSLHFMNPFIYLVFDKQIRAGIISELKNLFHCSK
ncbi:Tachykinin-like peptides receptor 99D [Trichoplax sp. H2]|nr:Tachykinin-like peptides receptor 99D [Trichoplax sp. H2]|eukprot:RDD39365.1 Tachykinin-like peptides receptor 99D [Trichoplax sp. H2]